MKNAGGARQQLSMNESEGLEVRWSKWQTKVRRGRSMIDKQTFMEFVNLVREELSKRLHSRVATAIVRITHDSSRLYLDNNIYKRILTIIFNMLNIQQSVIRRMTSFTFSNKRCMCCCMCMFIVSHATVCFCMFLVGYPQTPEPVSPPGRLAQIDLSCVDVP